MWPVRLETRPDLVLLLIVTLWLPFNLTLPLLGWRELVGHLPMYGILALLLIWGEERTETQQALVEGIAQQEKAPQEGVSSRVPRG